MPIICYTLGMRNNVRYAISVGDTAPAVHIQYIPRQLKLVTLNTTFTVVCQGCRMFSYDQIPIDANCSFFALVLISSFCMMFVQCSHLLQQSLTIYMACLLQYFFNQLPLCNDCIRLHARSISQLMSVHLVSSTNLLVTPICQQYTSIDFINIFISSF